MAFLPWSFVPTRQRVFAAPKSTVKVIAPELILLMIIFRLTGA